MKSSGMAKMNVSLAEVGMAKPPKRDKPSTEIELRPDGWERFEKAVDAAAKSGARHRPAKTRPASKGRVRKGKSRA